MKNVDKYSRNYFAPEQTEYQWMHREYVDTAPRWCSVDLRDGNQSLVVPMDLEKKKALFLFLCRMGFREIEVGFPAASDTEYQFVRTLIEHNLIPPQVMIQVLTPAREPIIRRTMQSLSGCKQAIVHLYNPTSRAQREQVFEKSKEEIIEIAVSAVRVIKECAAKIKGKIQLEYTPESFTATEPDFALEICNAVVEEWGESPLPVILNLASTVSLSLPHVYANQVEYISTHLHHRERVILSLAPAQRPRQRCSGGRAGIAGWRAAGGRDLVWQWGTHRKCGFGHFGAQPVFSRSRPAAGPFRPAKGRTDVRGIHRYADFSASPIRRRAGICRLFRLPSGCDCQRLSLEKAASEFPVECSLSAVGPTGHWAQL